VTERYAKLCKTHMGEDRRHRRAVEGIRAKGNEILSLANRRVINASFCESCGASLSPNVGFCSGCGNKLPNPLRMPKREAGYIL